MTISDKTRKMLWGQSGNKCAICKHEFIIGATATDNESLIGEECHIVSSRSNGPRFDASYPKEKLDSQENLILLCRIHHKMVDDQENTYTVDILRQMKNNHEIWVAKKLTDSEEIKPVKIRRVKQNIPDYLIRLTTGREIVNLIGSTVVLSWDHDELKSNEEVEIVGNFMQTLQDLGDLLRDLELSDVVKETFNLTKLLDELETAGFFVFGAKEVQVIEGGIKNESTPWPVAYIRVTRKDSQSVIDVNLEELLKNVQQTENTVTDK